MPPIVDQTHLVNCDFDRNSNKFVVFTLYDNATVESKWGRVGVTEQSKTWNFASQSEAKRQYDRKIADKLKIKSGRDAYTKVDIITPTVTSQSTVPSSNLEVIATRDIDVDSEMTRDLIRWLTKVNVHNIVSQTTMTYNETEGVFRTPLGIVGKGMVDRARVLLDEISPYVQMGRYDEASLKKLASEYLRIIPQDLGAANRKIRIEDIFTDLGLKKQSDLLDALDASIASVLTTPKNGSTVQTDGGGCEKVFNLKLHQCDDQDQRNAVDKLFNHTRKREHHRVAGYEFTNLYTVEKPDMTSAWENDGAKLNNRMRLWHGTSYANILSILKQGLIIPKRYTNGWAYGPGIYFSDQSTKSLQYASGFWTGRNEGSRIFMFLADVGMGKYYVPDGSIHKRPDGYDSVFAHAGKSGVANHEMIIGRPSQCNLLYLVEFRQ